MRFTFAGLSIFLTTSLLLGNAAPSPPSAPAPAPPSFAGAPASALSQVIAGPIFNPQNGHTYYLINAGTWTRCEALARELGGHLATVRNAQEQAWMVATFGPEKDFSDHAFWIGLRQTEDLQYVWASGETSCYRDWGPGEPNSSGSREGQFTFIGRYADGTWNDTNDQNRGANDGTPWSDFGPTPRGLVEVIPD